LYKSNRRVVSIFGILYGVTGAVEKYGINGSYKEFAGHDITLALGASKLDAKWLDKFVRMKEEWIECAKEWEEFYRNAYPCCGKLENIWGKEDWTQWPEMDQEELKEFEKDCSIM
jgi:hypothetical protein